jgi:hypothetical protein
MRLLSLLFACAATTIHAASISSLDQSSATESLLTTLFPQLSATKEMVDYVASLTSYAARMPITTLQQSQRYLFDRVFSKDQCAANRELPQPSLAAPEDQAYRYARYAAASYCITKSVLTNWNCHAHCDHPSTRGTSQVTVKEDLFTGVKFFTAVNQERREIIVSFRGTLVPAAVLVDAAFAQVKYDGHPGAPNGAKVHAGFQAAYKRVADLVRDHVRQFLKEHKSLMASGYTVHVTGHSMGGAIALFAALDLAANNILAVNKISLYTYGQPRTGNLDFADWVSTLGWQHLTRVTANGDLIPHVPPTFLDYNHHRSEVFLEGLWLAQEEQGIFMKMVGGLRDVVGLGRHVSYCKDQYCEAASCANSRSLLSINILYHLLYWDVVIGPWC